MKKLIVLVLLGAAAFWGWQRFNQETAVTDPIYVELRVKHSPSGVELVGVGRMNSQRDCEQRAQKVWSNVLTAGGELELSGLACKKEIATRFEDMFSNRPGHATYLALDRGNSGERDARLVIYGAPASEVEKVCPTFIERIKRNYTGQVKCVQGTVG